MIALSSLEELYSGRKKLNNLIQQQPDLYEELVHVTSLTRQLHIKYRYLGCILIEEDPDIYANPHLRASVIKLYNDEVRKLKNHSHFEEIRKLFFLSKEMGHENLCKLILGQRPETLKGYSG
ncbi:hypothetical protein [Alteribacillus bidgolensis]|nr:hypothetical protein [Alteribacillus bidgolensis]